MCLACPAKIDQILSDNFAKVDKEGIKLTVCTSLYPKLKVGDFVLIHAGFVIQKIEQTEAKERIQMIRELYESKR